MGTTLTEPGTALDLSSIQRAYLVGDQDGLELRGPARYYVCCDLALDRVDGLEARLARLVQANEILRTGVADGVVLPPVPAEERIRVEVRAGGAGVDSEVRRELCADDLRLGPWPQLRVVVVRSAHAATMHLVYALWLMDAASLEVFLSELVSDEPGVAGPPAPEPRDRTARDLRFWTDRVADLPEPAELPLRPGWRQAGPRTSHRLVTVAASEATAFARFATEHGLSVPMAYLAAYGVTLGRLGGGQAHTLTVLRSQRLGPVTADSLGNKGSAMPVAVPDVARSFVEIARQVQAAFLCQALHGSLSGSEIARLASRDGVVQGLRHPYAFTALEVDTAAERARGLVRRWEDVQLRVPQVLLDHQAVLDADGSVRLGFDWRTDAFDPGFVADLVDQHRALVAMLASSADRWTQVPRAGRSRPGRPPARAATDTLHDRVVRTAAANGRRPAVHDERGSMTYAELMGQSGALAADLVARGATPGSAVAVHLPRGRGQVVAILGCLLAGCVFVPLDRSTPPGRLGRIARRAALRFAVSDQPEVWADLDVPHLHLAEDGRTGAPPAGVPPTSTAYVIFTSGSTGEPKGVVVSHAAVLATVDAVNDVLDLSARDRVLSVSSIGFDLSVWDIFGPLLRGGSVVMLSEEDARSPRTWVDLIDRHGVSVWNSAPALASLLAEERLPLVSVRAFLLSGDWIPSTMPSALRALAPAAEVVSLGGATEGAIWSILHRVEEGDEAGRSIPYGRPLRNQDVVVLDAAGETCADWQVGELFLCGAGVADGYLNDVDKMAAAFGHHPHLGWVYRTGDRGRRHPSGVVEFLGRTDTQVKLHGHRVELGEIEQVIEGMTEVVRCAVSVRPAGRRGRLVAHVVLGPGVVAAEFNDAAEALLTHALPRYMVPDDLVVVDEIPLTGNGKVDRRRLTSLTVEEVADRDAPAVSLDGAHAEGVARIWQAVLGVPPGELGFFDAGGTSYDAIRLLSLVRSELGHQVPFGSFMSEPTYQALAARCHEAGPSDGIWSVAPRTVPSPRARVVLFPPVGGGVACYDGLVARLSPDVDVVLVGLDAPPGPGGRRTPTLADLARACVRAIPAGALTRDVPLVFAGWSFGGALAFEAARLCGVPVARVVVVDTPVSRRSRGADGTVGAPAVAAFVDDVRRTGGQRVDAEQIEGDPVLAGRFEVYRHNLTLLREWVPVPGDTCVVALDASDDPAEREDGAWAGLARAVRSGVLSGGHYDVFADHNLPLATATLEGAIG